MTPASSSRSTHWSFAVAGTALAYVMVGWAGLSLTVAPGWASPLYPSAGVALACVLILGWPALAGVAIGALTTNLLAASGHGALTMDAVALPAVFAIGSAAQAALGTVLVRRFVTNPLTLSELRDITIFFGCGGLLACLTCTSVAALGIWLLQPEAVPDLLLHWGIWWAGDTLGVLIGAPVVLTLLGQPRSEWAPRRLPLGLTLAVATLLMALAIKQVGRWEEARVQASFERDAIHASSNLASKLQHPLHALEALHGLFLGSADVSADELRRTSAAWLAPHKHLKAMGWGEFIDHADAPDDPARAQASGPRESQVFDQRNGGIQSHPDDRLLFIRYIEPLPDNAAALGANARSTPPSRAAIDAAVRTNLPSATAGFPIAQDNSGAQTGVVIYQAIYRGTPATANEREAAAAGAVFVTLRVDETLKAVEAAMPHYLKPCIVDTTDPQAEQQRVAGPPGCETEQGDLVHVRSIGFGGRQWDLRILAQRSDVPDSSERTALLFSMIGLPATAMLGALLLTVTGRTRRIEAAVNDRTIALQREISEREETEAALRESEQRFRNILNNVPIGVVYTDLAGNVKQVNPRFCQLTGYTGEQLLEMNVSSLTHPEDRIQNEKLSGQLVAGDIPMYRRQGRYLTRDARMVWVQAIVTLLRDLHGRPRRIVAVVEDITEHLRLADAERAREVAEAANHAKSEFLSRMSHELRTPLNAMLGFAQLLELDQNHPLPASQRPWVSQIQDAGWHLLDMINDVLDLSRIESGTLNLQADPLNLAEIVSSTLALVERDAQRRGILVSQDIAEGTTRVTGDATRVKQILTNLLSNAVKYNIDNGRIHIATRASHRESVEITVTDTGLGMTPQQLAQLFQPFNRLGRERSSLEGTGIGLVISQRLAELMGGALRARSTAGEGSAFILTLPRADGPGHEPSTAREDPSSPGNYHQRIVHYVEDNETNVEVMRGILSRRPQVSFDVSITGLDGLVAIRARRPDLILLDMHLPDIDGMELLRHLKADPSTCHIPVIVVSADALASQIHAAMEAGAQQYLTKPVSVTQLLGVVDGLLDGTDTRFN